METPPPPLQSVCSFKNGSNRARAVQSATTRSPEGGGRGKLGWRRDRSRDAAATVQQSLAGSVRNEGARGDAIDRHNDGGDVATRVPALPPPPLCAHEIPSSSSLVTFASHQARSLLDLVTLYASNGCAPPSVKVAPVIPYQLPRYAGANLGARCGVSSGRHSALQPEVSVDCLRRAASHFSPALAGGSSGCRDAGGSLAGKLCSTAASIACGFDAGAALAPACWSVGFFCGGEGSRLLAVTIVSLSSGVDAGLGIG